MRFGGEVFVGRALGRAFGVLGWAALVLLAGGAEALGQVDGRKIEVGAQFSFFRESRPTSSPSIIPYLALYPDPAYPNPASSSPSSPNNPGFGGRVGYNFSSHISVEGKFNFFPVDNSPESYFLGTLTIGEARGNPTVTETPHSSTSTGRKAEVVFGLKTGGRIDNLGLFAKFRPGLVHFGEVSGFEADTNFAMDLGTVIEYYPSRRTLIRVDLSDLMVRFDERRTGSGTYSFTDLTNFLLGNVSTTAPSVRVLRPSQTTHNFRMGVGFGFRF